ncbi:alpha/beta hydrolase [Frankia sp. AgB32]|uniref:alpha/beta hydrolase n=1 Tax=Frankia sp. AgB32 TaxID=631119 RepID=UPI00200F2081|nr:alpha/beta hydrolase [Frankia sp. AgB32]
MMVGPTRSTKRGRPITTREDPVIPAVQRRHTAAAAACAALAAGVAVATRATGRHPRLPGGPRATEFSGDHSATPPGTWELRDVPYARLSAAQRLDLYRPTAPSSADAGARRLPVVLTIHGGAFALGDKRDDAPVVATLLAAGYAVAAVNYRLSGEARFPAAVQDVKAAVRWLRAHADDHGLDPDRIAASGQSAGGYLAVMLGATAGVAMYDDPRLGSPGVSSAVQAVIDFYAPVNFASMDEQARSNPRCAPADAQHGRAGSPESRFLGRTVATAPQLVRAASPLHYLGRAALPPFLIEHGDADCVVPHGQSLELAEALRAAGAPAVELTIIPGAGHGALFPAAPRMAAVVDFLDRALGR